MPKELLQSDSILRWGQENLVLHLAFYQLVGAYLFLTLQK